VLRASLVAEQAGVPTISVIETGFWGLAELTAKSMGADLPMVEYPGRLRDESAELQRQKMQGLVLESIVDVLGRQTEQLEAEPEPEPRDVVLRGAPAEISEQFVERGWSEGLPIVPPTIERVEAFLRFTDREPDEVLGVLPPETRSATVWTVAINGVMAGCKPEYMPILIAVAECMADPGFRLLDQGSTPGWEPLIVVNGPIVEELGFRTEAGALRTGNRANTTVGRFLGLMLRNAAGLRPGESSKGSFGGNFFVALAENEDVCDELGWLPMSADTRGFAPGENVVTLRGVVSVAGPVYPPPPVELTLPYFREFLAEDVTMWSIRTGILYRKWSALYAISPRVARVLAEAGMSKRDFARYLYENAKVPASKVERFDRWLWREDLRGSWSIAGEVEAGVLPAERYLASDDPDRPVPVFMTPESIEIVVAGLPANNQARGLFNNHEQGWPVSRRVELPRRWAELVR
jgi:hypothetical protein